MATYNIPNLISFFRILLVPCLVAIYFLPNSYLSLYEKDFIATAIFILAALSDWLDGYLARRLNQTSKFGAFIDPVADKFIVITALILLVELDRISALIGIIIIGREFVVSALREWMAIIGKSSGVAVAFIGKLKTVFQMIAIPCLLFAHNISFIPIYIIGSWLINIAAILTIVSMIFYLNKAIQSLKDEKQ
jgi:CDP-diacylglycerol--glycerol-3-phosphate 3-phosphatidyltransferase